MNVFLLQNLKKLCYLCNQQLADLPQQKEDFFILGSTSYTAELPMGTSLSAEQLMILLVVIFLFFKFFSGTNKPPKKKEEKPPKITFQEILMAGIGTLKPLGNNIYERRKLISKKDDIETYLTVTKIDRSHIRVEEKQKATTNYNVFIIIICILVAAMLLQYLIYGL